MFLFATSMFRSALGPTQSPTPWVSGALSPAVKRPGRETDTNLNILLSLTMRGSISSFLRMAPWRGA
jgi:hypothetical protein